MTQLIFATWGSGLRVEIRKQLYRRACLFPVVNVLATRAYPREINMCIEYSKLLPKQVNFWLDSGAFSAWTKGHAYQVKEYLEFVQKLIPHLHNFRKVFVISLDKIPGQIGRPVTSQHVKQAVQQTLDNTYFLIKNGLNVVPIHHQGEPHWVMLEYLKLAEYVGISPANDSPQISRKNYISSLYPLFKTNTGLIKPAHNFGNISPSQLKLFPFYSADSQTWKAACMSFGRSFDIKIHKSSSQSHSNLVSARAKVEPVSLLAENIKLCLDFEKDLAQLWAYRKISWIEPKGIDL